MFPNQFTDFNNYISGVGGMGPPGLNPFPMHRGGPIHNHRPYRSVAPSSALFTGFGTSSGGYNPTIASMNRSRRALQLNQDLQYRLLENDPRVGAMARAFGLRNDSVVGSAAAGFINRAGISERLGGDIRDVGFASMLTASGAAIHYGGERHFGNNMLQNKAAQDISQVLLSEMDSNGRIGTAGVSRSSEILAAFGSLHGSDMSELNLSKDSTGKIGLTQTDKDKVKGMFTSALKVVEDMEDLFGPDSVQNIIKSVYDATGIVMRTQDDIQAAQRMIDSTRSVATTFGIDQRQLLTSSGADNRHLNHLAGPLANQLNFFAGISSGVYAAVDPAGRTEEEYKDVASQIMARGAEDSRVALPVIAKYIASTKGAEVQQEVNQLVDAITPENRNETVDKIGQLLNVQLTDIARDPEQRQRFLNAASTDPALAEEFTKRAYEVVDQEDFSSQRRSLFDQFFNEKGDQPWTFYGGSVNREDYLDGMETVTRTLGWKGTKGLTNILETKTGEERTGALEVFKKSMTDIGMDPTVADAAIATATELYDAGLLNKGRIELIETSTDGASTMFDDKASQLQIQDELKKDAFYANKYDSETTRETPLSWADATQTGGYQMSLEDSINLLSKGKQVITENVDHRRGFSEVTDTEFNSILDMVDSHWQADVSEEGAQVRKYLAAFREGKDLEGNRLDRKAILDRMQQGLEFRVTKMDDKGKPLLDPNGTPQTTTEQQRLIAVTRNVNGSSTVGAAKAIEEALELSSEPINLSDNALADLGVGGESIARNGANGKSLIGRYLPLGDRDSSNVAADAIANFSKPTRWQGVGNAMRKAMPWRRDDRTRADIILDNIGSYPDADIKNFMDIAERSDLSDDGRKRFIAGGQQELDRRIALEASSSESTYLGTVRFKDSRGNEVFLERK